MAQEPLLSIARRPSVLAGALRVSALVGTLLNLINQAPRVLDGETPSWLHVALNYVVPFCVATYSAARSLQRAGNSKGAVRSP
jgi:hypothetical protein